MNMGELVIMKSVSIKKEISFLNTQAIDRLNEDYLPLDSTNLYYALTNFFMSKSEM
jgi:hypothetical protein